MSTTSKKQALPRFIFIIGVLMGFYPNPGYAVSLAREIAQAKARQKLADTLIKVEQFLDVKEASRPESKSVGGKEFNANDGNSITSNTTYHSYVWDHCLKWTQNGFRCQEWLDPYISEHGNTSDRSALEEIVYKFWKAGKKPGDDGSSGSFGIWNIAKKAAGSLLDRDGKLDKKDITKWELTKDVKEGVEKVAKDTANRAVRVTMDESARFKDTPIAKVATPMESLRLMASSWTKTLRNRMVANIGELRAADKGVEFALGEDVPECANYLTALKDNAPQNKTDQGRRIEPQALLQMETKNVPVEERYRRCVELRQASVYMVNAKSTGRGVSAGSPEEEQADKWRSRLNIAAIDRAGIDLNSLPKPSFAELTQEEIASPIATYNRERGQTVEVMTNADQLESYNALLRKAASAMKIVAAKSSYIVDASKMILSNQIKPGTMSAIEINDLTPEMKGELKSTGLPRATEIAQAPERTPSQLTVTAVR